jgi:hypothetical protein
MVSHAAELHEARSHLSRLEFNDLRGEILIRRTDFFGMWVIYQNLLPTVRARNEEEKRKSA